jgi:hypothetical protein
MSGANTACPGLQVPRRVGGLGRSQRAIKLVGMFVLLWRIVVAFGSCLDQVPGALGVSCLGPFRPPALFGLRRTPRYF